MSLSDKKQNPLEYVPDGLIVTKSWLLSKKLSRHTLDNWVKSEQLNTLVYGVYKRPNTKLTWRGVVYSLQRMGSDLSPGGITVLTYQGFGHYLELGKQKTIHLYGKDTLPSWINKLLPEVTFIRHNRKKLWGNNNQINLDSLDSKFTIEMGTDPTLSLNEGTQPIKISSLEKAWFEVLLDVPNKVSFEHADQLMQGLVNLSPHKLNKLMDYCQNIKVRRLFLWFAERHQHTWVERLELSRFTMESGLLGSGKRVLAKNGKLDSKYLITIPKEICKEEIYG